MKITRHWRWLIATGAIFVPAVALGTVTIPFSFTSGTVIKAADMNSNFSAFKTAVDALQAQKPIVVSSWDAAATTNGPGGGDPAFIPDPTGAGSTFWRGTAATSVPAGATVSVSVTFLPINQGGTMRMAACAVPSSGSFLNSPTHFFTPASPTDTSAVASMEVRIQHVFTIATAGSYRFGLCNVTLMAISQASNISAIATVYPQ
ncbi:MAG TPA: hypothetical protein VGI10_02410 [Polyangiaceae bacterium]|jgi:hypothetical protein